MRFMIKFQTELEKQNFTSMIAFEKKSIRTKQKNYNRNKISTNSLINKQFFFFKSDNNDYYHHNIFNIMNYICVPKRKRNLVR